MVLIPPGGDSLMPTFVDDNVMYFHIGSRHL